MNDPSHRLTLMVEEKPGEAAVPMADPAALRELPEARAWIIPQLAGGGGFCPSSIFRPPSASQVWRDGLAICVNGSPREGRDECPILPNPQRRLRIQPPR